MGADSLIRCSALVYHRGKQRGLEPAAVLIGTFQIQVSRPLEAVILFHYRRVRNAAVEPNIHDVIFFGEFLAAAFTLYFRREEFRQILCPPCIGAFLAEQCCNIVNCGIVDNRLFAVLAVNNRNRNAPGTLTGNTPVTPVTNHALDTVFAPFRNPANVFNCLDCLILKAVYRAEPLFSSTVDNRLMAAPAVRILVDNFFCCQHCADFCQLCCNGTVCFIGIHAFKFAGFLCLAALCVHADQNANIVIVLADFKVLYAIARCCMYTTGTAFQRNVIAHNNRRKSVIERMLCLHVLQFAAHKGAYGFVLGDAGSLHGRRNQFRSHAVIFISNPNQGIFISRAYADCQVARNCPGSCCPDYEVDLFLCNAQLSKQPLVICYLKFHIDGIAGIVFIFDFCFCQCGVAVRAPVYRL